MKRRSFILVIFLVTVLMASGIFADAKPAIRVQMYNANLASRINTIFPWYRISNTGSTSVRLADVRIRYFYTIDGEKTQRFWCDWSSVGNTNVTGTFNKLDAPFAGADYCFELGFKPEAGYLQPGRSIDVQSRIAKNDWSDYNQTNDYSFNPIAKNYVDWDKITVLTNDPEDFETSCDYTQDGQWVRGPVVIHLTVSGANATTYYAINGAQAIAGNLIEIHEDGIYDVSFWSVGQTGYSETPHRITVKIDGTGPVVTGNMDPVANTHGWINRDAIVSFSATDALSGVAFVAPPVTVTTEGAGQAVSGQAADHAGNASLATVTVNLDKTPPVIVNLLPGNGHYINDLRPVISADLADELSGVDPSSIRLTLDGTAVALKNLTAGRVRYQPSTNLSEGKHAVTLQVCDQAGNLSAVASSTFTVEATIPPIPPDPATVTPKLDPTVATNTFDATKFLYTGENPIQTGMAPETIEPRRAAVIRGKVMDKDGQPLPGAVISILNHPEYGQTVSRLDGMFDLAVNGGGLLTVKYERSGYLSAQRQVNVPWQDYVWAPEVILIPYDTKVTTVELNSSQVQVAQGNTVTDVDGVRQATLIIPSGTRALGYSGSNLNIRATEFTVGENGHKAMPAQLPPNIAYTYCVELSTDELDHVQFNQPIYFYLENFINFPVGGIVPVGYYDKSKGVWIPSDNGIIIRILNINNGMADIDITGTGQAADDTALAKLGVTNGEREQLARLYQPGQSLWRVPITHFTPWDCNWPYGPPSDAIGPNGGNPKGNEYCENPNHCFIERENQVVRESVEIPGVPFTLNYSSDRANGRITNRTIHIPLSGASLPASLKRIELEISIAGQIIKKSYSNAPNQTAEYTWDGKDGFGRKVEGLQKVTIRVGYVYDVVFQAPVRFGLDGNGNYITGNRATSETTMWKDYTLTLGAGPISTKEMNGWNWSNQHYYDAYNRTLYMGDGSKRSANSISSVITTIAGMGDTGFSGDGGPATMAKLHIPTGVAVGPDGSVYIADYTNNRIRRVGPDGIITTVVGAGGGASTGDGGPAIEARIRYPKGIAIGPDGSIYICETFNSNRIRRVDPNGIITTIVGTKGPGYSGDGGPAIEAQIDNLQGIAVGPDGSVYIADCNNNRIRRVGPDGIITTIAGMGERGHSGDGGPATQARLYNPSGIAIGPDGSIYIAEYFGNSIRRVGPDGIITTIAGTGSMGYSGDGGPAIQARLKHPQGLAVGPDGSIYIADCDNHCIRHVGPDGVITTIAGTGEMGYSGDGGPAAQAELCFACAITIGPDGSIYIADAYNNRIRKVSSCFPVYYDIIAIASEDGSEIYQFNSDGRHLQTIDALSKTVIYKFDYDQNGNLIGITDVNGNNTTISRIGSQVIITAPFGQQTTMTINSDGYIETITNAANETRRFTYLDGGLLETITDPKGQKHQFKYNELGLAVEQINPDGGSIRLERTKTELGYEVKVIQTIDQTDTYVNTFSVETLPTGETKRVTKPSTGNSKIIIIDVDGACETITYPDGTIVRTTKGPDPRFGMQSPIVTAQTITTPQGLLYSITANRTVSLGENSDPFSMQTQTDTVTINGKTTTTVYDAATRTITTTSPLGRKTVSTLDEKGRIIKTEVAGLAPVTFEYDARGRLYRTTEGTGSQARITEMKYNDQGYVESITDPLLRTTKFEYDLAGRVTVQTLPNGKVIRYAYDANGNVTKLTPPGRPEHGFDYTPADLEENYNPPMIAGVTNGKTHTDYNLNRQPTLVTRPDGQTIGFEYDTMGRLVTLTVPEGDTVYVYDAQTGHLKNIASPGGNTLGYAYDGSLTTQVTWGGQIQGNVGVEYDNFFRVKSQSVNDGYTVNYGYDDDGLLIQAGETTIHRDAQNGRMTGTTHGSLSESFGYNEFGEIQDYRAAHAGTELLNVHYAMDKLGRIETKTETVDGVTITYVYSYDVLGQLTDVRKNGVLVAHYDYDDNGNRLGGVYDDQDRMLQYGSNSYTYSDNGELQEKNGSGGSIKYQYDVLGNLKEVLLPDGTAIEYLIDGANRRIGRKVNGVLMQGFLYQNALNPVAELDGSGNVVTRFVYGTKGNIPDYMIKNGTTYRIVSDHLGSPRLIVEVATGSVVQRMDYDEFGNVTLDTNPGFQPFGFAGGIYDPETNLVRFGARDYDAETGRWTCKDPIGFGGGDTNIYRYCENEPISKLDPIGKNDYNFVRMYNGLWQQKLTNIGNQLGKIGKQLMKAFNISLEADTGMGLSGEISSNPDSICSVNVYGAEGSIDSKGRKDVGPNPGIEHPLLPFSYEMDGTFGLKYPPVGPVRVSLNFNPGSLIEPFITDDPYFWWDV